MNRQVRPVFRSTQAVGLCLLCALAMAYGWGWRGSYGHEAGAMLPGALLGMAVCLGSGREDWYRRTALAGLCGAIGWAWGGGLSNMEQTFYVVSDSLPDVAWAFACIFLVGLLWSGVGAACLSFALTEPRSVLNGYIGPLVVNGVALFAVYLVFLVRPDVRETVDAFGVANFHDTKYLSATVILVASSLCWLLRRNERLQAGLFVQGAVGWWVGYLLFTKFGGLELAPPNRSEGWGGYVGILAVLVLYLARRGNRAGLWMTLVGAFSGGLAFVVALFLTHPLVVRWGPFADTTITNTWKLTEEGFGLWMGLGVGIAACGLVRGSLRPPAEDADCAASDQFAAFVLLVVMMWLNLRGNVRDWGRRYDLLPHDPIAGLVAWQWFFLVGVVMTGLALYVFWRLRRGTLDMVLPPSPFGKGALLFLVILWIAQCAVALHRFADWKSGSNIFVETSYWLLAAMTTWALFVLVPNSRVPDALRNLPMIGPQRDASDPWWRPSRGYWIAWLSVPLVLIGVTFGAMAMQDGPLKKFRLRFGPEAYWRTQQKQVKGKALP